MIGRIRSRVNSAHLIGVVALVFAVGGGLALANVPKNSVNSNKVKNNTLKSVDIRNNSLTGQDIKNLTGGDVTDDSLGGADINEASLNITLPAPPPSAVQTVGTLLAGNQSASVVAGSYTVTVATDNVGNCSVWQISAAEDGEFVEADLSEGQTNEGADAVAAGETDNLDVLNSDSDAGPIYALSEDGTGNGVFTLQANEFGNNNRCAVSLTGIST
jgi:hypothetical protein